MVFGKNSNGDYNTGIWQFIQIGQDEISFGSVNGQNIPVYNTWLGIMYKLKMSR